MQFTGSDQGEGPTCRMVIPVYRALSAREQAIVAHNAGRLPSCPVAVIGAEGDAPILSEAAAALRGATGSEVRVETFASGFFRSQESYSRLLMDRAFYRRFTDRDYILICQHDALILGDDLDPWLRAGYGMVGAPVFRGFGAPEHPLAFTGALNGGLSLRHVAGALKVIDRTTVIAVRRGHRFWRKSSLFGLADRLSSTFRNRRLALIRPGLNEDVFWSVMAPALVPEFRVPEPETAAGFAFEACPTHLYDLTGGLPFGCHAFDLYEPGFWAAHLPEALNDPVGSP